MEIKHRGAAQLLGKGMGWLGRRKLAQTSGRLHLKGLAAPVEVIRDRWGVPHIYAQNERDLFFAQGFVHAQDRFWQMEFQRRLVAGRLAEIFGNMALYADRWMRMLGMQHVAEEEVGLLDELDRRVLQAYCDGVNAYIDQRCLPLEFDLLRYRPEPWRPADSLAWSKMMAWMLSSNWECELFRQKLIDKLGPEATAQLELGEEDSWPLVLGLTDVLGLGQRLNRLSRRWAGPGAREGVGSNNWAVAGALTASGKPILANDMHLMLSAPAVWYENHLIGGPYNVTGVSLPGLPMIISGHNGRLAWGFTASYSDVQDLYEEHLRQGVDGQVEYEFEGQWLPAEVRRETIRVRGGAEQVQEVVITRHGPVINELVEETDRPPLALCWTAYETSGGTLRALDGMNRAENCAAFREAILSWNLPVLNMIYADVEGNIAYSLAGKVPIRAQGDGKTPVPGWTGTHEWQGAIPPAELPHIFNPPQGYLVTANNRVASADYPYCLGHDYINGDRAERITELLLCHSPIDVPYVQRMQFDQVSPSAQTLAGLLGRLRSDDPRLAAVTERMRRWDGSLGVGSAEASIYQVISRQLLVLIFENRLGDLMPRFAGQLINPMIGVSLWGHHAWDWLRHELLVPNSPWFDLGNGEQRDDVLLEALRRSLDFLECELGPQMENWRWGRFHILTFHHHLGRVKPLDQVFNLGPYPVGGDGNTIWATASVLDKLDSSDGVVGPPFRFIADLADLDHSLGLLAPGNSGQPGSPHYDDQVTPWFEGGYHLMAYNREDVLREMEARLELLPAGLS